MSDWGGVERRSGPDPAGLQTELKAVRQDVGRLAGAVATLGSDERMQAVMNAVIEEERRHRVRILVPIIVGLVVVATLGVFQLSLTSQARDTSRKAGKVSSFVDHCLVHPALATPGECGNAAATGAQTASVVALFCYLELPQGQRTDATASDCFAKARAATAATVTTSTTRSG